jgi:hypothetical protein
MDDLFLLKLVLSFIVGGIAITISTVAAERLGSNVGGILSGIPSTSAVTLFFVALVDTPQAAAEATTIAPLILGFNSLFLLLYAIFARHGILAGLGVPLLLWLGLALGSVLIKFENFSLAIAAYLILFPLCYYVADQRLNLPVYGSHRVAFTPLQLASRATFAGSVIALGVYLSRVGGPVWGGIMSIFPAVYLSAFSIAYKARGIEFSRALVKPQMFSSMTNVMLYTLAVRYTYPTLGILGGTLLAYVVASFSAYGSYRFVNRSRQPPATGPAQFVPAADNDTVETHKREGQPALPGRRHAIGKES